MESRQQHLKHRTYQGLGPTGLRRTLNLGGRCLPLGEGVVDGLERNVDADNAAETETVHDGAGGAGDPDGNAFELGVLDPVAQRCPGETDDPEWQVRSGRAGLVRNADPDLRRELGADVVYKQRGEQAEYRAGHAGAHGGLGVVLGELNVRAAIQTARDPLDRAIFHQPTQRPRVNANRGCVALAEEGLRAETPQAGGPGPGWSL